MFLKYYFAHYTMLMLVLYNYIEAPAVLVMMTSFVVESVDDEVEDSVEFDISVQLIHKISK